MSPGSGLGTVLAGLDPGAVANADTVVLLQAWARQLAHVQARFAAAVVQVGRAAAFSGSGGERPSVAESALRHPAAGEWAAGELSAAMRWTHSAAGCELAFSEELFGLPVVFAALDAGALDRARAWTFVDVLGTADLLPEQVRCICEALVPPAPRWTTAQLRARLLRMVLEVDPAYAERRYRAAVRDRGVTGYLGRVGTGTVSGHGLAADEAVAACERLEALADEVAGAGHPGAIGQIRADLFTRLLDGRFHGLTRPQMISAMLAEHEAAGEQSDGPIAGSGSPAAAEDAAAEDAATADPAAADPAAADPAAAGPAAADAADAGTAAADAADADLATADSPADTGLAAGDAEGSGGAAAGFSDESAGRATAVRPGGEIRIGLGTLLGLDERPGEVPGWGPVLAGVARRMVATRGGAQWRFAVTDDEGHLVLAGVTRRRPSDIRRSHGGVVEIHVSEALLVRLATAAASTGQWAPVVADIARRYAERDAHREALRRHPDDRFARAALRRHVQVRDRHCVAPGCRRPARRCQLDHTLDHALGGATLEENSGPLCLRHHLMKHEAGWRLEQPAPGVFRWTSPLGQVYECRGEPISPAPGPVRARPPEPESWWRPTRRMPAPIMCPRPQPPPDPPPAPRRVPPADDEPPPF